MQARSRILTAFNLLRLWSLINDNQPIDVQTFRRFIPSLILAVLAAQVAYLAWVALHLRLDYFDTYEILLNARRIVSGEGIYYWKRPFIFPLIMSPIFLIEKFTAWNQFSLVACHLFAVLIFALLLQVFYKLLRLHFDRLTALVGTFLFSLNPLLIHAAPFAKEDVCATFFLTSTFYCYLYAERKSRFRYYVFAGLLSTLTMGTRYNLIPVAPAVIFIHECAAVFSGPLKITSKLDQRRLAKAIVLFILPAALFLTLASLFYTTLGLAPFRTSLERFMSDQYLQFLKNVEGVPPSVNYQFLLKAVSWPWLILFVMGLFLTWKSSAAGFLFHITWFIVVFILQTYFIAVKEPRYLFPLFPPFYAVVTLGFLQIIKWLLRKFHSIFAQSLGVGTISLALIIYPVRMGIAELSKFRDPVYSSDFAGNVSRYAHAVAGTHDNDIFWVGHYYPTHPKDYVFHPEDNFTYVYHLFKHVVRFYTRKNVYFLDEIQFFTSSAQNTPIFVGPNIRRFAHDGDVLIINTENSPYSAKTLPAKLKPLTVQRVREVEFEPASSEKAGEPGLFQSSRMRTATIGTLFTPDGFVVRGSGIPDGRYEVILYLPQSTSAVFFSIVDVKNGQFGHIERGVKQDIRPAKIGLLFYDAVKAFHPPHSK